MKPWMLLVAALAVSLSIAAPPDGDPTAAVDLKLTDVKTKFAANMCMWFRGDHIERMKQATLRDFGRRHGPSTQPHGTRSATITPEPGLEPRTGESKVEGSKSCQAR